MSSSIRRRGAGVAFAAAALALATAGPAVAAAPQADAAAQPSARSQTVAAASAASVDDDDVDYDTWQQDVRAAVDEAQAYVDERTAQGGDSKQAIVLDIDNTSLETYFSWIPPTPAVKPVLDLAKFADSRGVDIFFVTARPGFIDFITQYNLEEVGYPVDGLYGRSLDEIFGEVQEYKTRMRTKIEERGYTIIANIGNNTTDLEGGHAERTFKLPDYDGEMG